MFEIICLVEETLQEVKCKFQGNATIKVTCMITGFSVLVHLFLWGYF